MPVWKGWTATSVPAVTGAPTWDAWTTCQQRALSRKKQQQETIAFSERELARLLFVRWLYQRGSLGVVHNDNT